MQLGNRAQLVLLHTADCFSPSCQSVWVHTRKKKYLEILTGGGWKQPPCCVSTLEGKASPPFDNTNFSHKATARVCAQQWGRSITQWVVQATVCGQDYQSYVHLLKLLGWVVGVVSFRFVLVCGSRVFFILRLSSALNSRALAGSAAPKSAPLYPDIHRHPPLPAVPFCFHLKATLHHTCL